MRLKSAALGTWPAWLHEGMAQTLSGDKLPPELKAQIKHMAGIGALPKLESFKQEWSGMSTQNATLAYGVALAVADLFF